MWGDGNTSVRKLVEVAIALSGFFPLHRQCCQFLMKMLLGLSKPLPNLVESQFKAAKASEALIFSSTKLAIIRTTAGVPVRHVNANSVLS